MKALRVLLLLVVLGALGPAQQTPLFEVSVSTRTVTCLGPDGVGTTGGLRRLSDGALLLPGVPVRGLSGAWVASERGLYRDGRRVDAAPCSSVLALPSGLVVGRPRGVVEFRESKVGWQCPTTAPIHSLAWDGECLWAASLEGLFRLGSGGAERVSIARDPLTETVTSLVADDQGHLGVGTAAGAFRRRGSDFARLGQQEVSALALGPQGELYVGTPSQGVWKESEAGLQRMLGVPDSVSSLLWTSSGLLVGTPSGAFRGGQPAYSWAGEVAGNHITALACRGQEVVAGTFQDGLARLESGRWSSLPGPEWVNQVALVQGALLARYSDGSVRRVDDGRSLGRADGWPKAWTSWLGDEGVGTLSALYLPSPRAWQVLAPKPALQNVTVTALARRGSEVWAGSQTGLFCFRHGQVTQVLDGLSDSWITALAVYREQVFAGTFRGGLCVSDGQGWRVLATGRVHCLKATSRALWVGTPGGLLAFDGRSWRRFGCDEGLPGACVWALTAQGNDLWVGTDNGLARANQDRLLEMPAGSL